MKHPTIFLDQDGTLIKDHAYGIEVSNIEFIDGVREGLKKLQDSGFKLVIVTNQAAVALGYIKEENVKQIHQKIVEDLCAYNVRLWKIYYCPHNPDSKCGCRKPDIGMVKNIIDDIDIENSFMIGDKEVDVLFGKNLGVKTIRLSNDATSSADYITPRFSEVVDFIIKSATFK